MNLYNSVGSAWTADYLKVTGQPEVDLRNNIAAEARAKITYERLMDFTKDNDTKDALQFLMTREITHMKSFMIALDGLGRDPLEIGELPPTEGLVNQFVNDSTGEGQDGATDFTTTWAKKHGLEVVENPAVHPDRIDADGQKSKSKN